MKQLSPKNEIILSGVKSVYLNPYHYTYVIQKEDNHIYLYDEMTMEIIGKTKVAFNETFKTFTFTDNFNMFCTYIECRINPPQQPQIIVFTLEADGVISHYRHMLTRNRNPQSLVLFHISFYQKFFDKENKDREKCIIGLSRNKIYYINLSGQIGKEIQIRHQNRELNLINGFSIKQNKWIFIEEKRLYFATIGDKYTINDSLVLDSKIASIFLDASVRGQFMAFITQIHTVIILCRKQEKWVMRHKFKIPNLNIRKLCFFYPGVNTSTTNKFKDRLYLLIYGEPPNIEDRRTLAQCEDFFDDQKTDKYPIPKEFIEGQHLYIHEYSIDQLYSAAKGHHITPRELFCIRNVGAIKYTIWANQHAQNCILLFNEDRNVVSMDLISILQDLSAAKEWVALSYRFEARTSNVLYEETEDNFQNQKQESKTISLTEVNDWSYCLFPKESVVRKTIKRLNCLEF